MKPADISGSARVRQFRLKDFPAVLSLWRRTEGVGLNEADTRAGIAKYLRRNPGMSFVAELDGKIVGAVLCGHDGRRGYLNHLAVAKKHRNCGIGTRLFKACADKLRALGIGRVSIMVFDHNADGMDFWKRNGWFIREDLRVMQFKILDKPFPRVSKSKQ